jgi:hypothetical protein
MKPGDWRRRHLHWNGPRLYRSGSKVAVAEIVPDTQWTGMWRVRLPDGQLSDMVNVTRARDAAMELALADLNRQDRAGRGVEAAPMRETDQAATSIAPADAGD